jgi:predicted NAD/FAD-binding protein
MAGQAAERLKIAVVGSGISGLSAAWLLSQRHEIVLFETASRVGGHANTVFVTCPEGEVAVDTGFIVYNEEAYPNLTALLKHLGVPTHPTKMSFAVSLDGGRLEYSGGTLGGLLAQKRNLVRPRFWSMLRDLVRFYRSAPASLALLNDPNLTLGEYLDVNGYGEPFQNDHLLPMAGAIWSAPPLNLRDYPAAAFIRFNENHGLLRLRNRPTWRSVVGGSREYVEQLTAPFADRIRISAPVMRVRRDARGVTLDCADGASARFDHVVIATHPDQALAIVESPTHAERELLGSIRYTRSKAVLHTDPAFMPRRRAAWSSWNYAGCSDGGRDTSVSVTYWMNSLQQLPTKTPLFVSLNPDRDIAAGAELHRETYDHPLFDPTALSAQGRLWSLQGQMRTWYCGAWFGSGFHEDGLQSGLAVAEALGGLRRPWQVAEESGRISLGVPRPDQQCGELAA